MCVFWVLAFLIKLLSLYLTITAKSQIFSSIGQLFCIGRRVPPFDQNIWFFNYYCETVLDQSYFFFFNFAGKRNKIGRHKCWIFHWGNGRRWIQFTNGRTPACPCAWARPAWGLFFLSKLTWLRWWLRLWVLSHFLNRTIYIWSKKYLCYINLKKGGRKNMSYVSRWILSWDLSQTEILLYLISKLRGIFL